MAETTVEGTWVAQLNRHLRRVLRSHTVNVDFLRIEYMVLAKYQHMSILELILLVKQPILILSKNLLGVAVLIIVN